MIEFNKGQYVNGNKRSSILSIDITKSLLESVPKKTEINIKDENKDTNNKDIINPSITHKPTIVSNNIDLYNSSDPVVAHKLLELQSFQMQNAS